ncbi:CD209 [Branchiostoma lanceolatum]|uniref:CD209 protein n=1 Tax=Branchiostoma lanceolatum TaxID=7740 RepID=A0A8J9WFN2_BRALA|nr:CD209 [Branchiostoma lanceolatum]
MAENVYKESCNVYETCNDDGDYQEACTISPSKVSATTLAPDVNCTTETANISTEILGPPGLSGSNDKRKVAGPESVFSDGYIPGVGMRSTNQPQVWTGAMLKTLPVMTIVLNLCLLGTVIFLAVTVSELKLSVDQLDHKTAMDLSDLKFSVSQLNLESTMTTAYLLNVSVWIQQIVGKSEPGRTEEEKSGETRLHKLDCPYGYKKYREVCYKVFDIEKTFSESAATCLADGGTLAMPRDTGINTFLFSLIKAVDTSKNFWFGLDDKKQEGEWEWADGTALGTGYSAWREGQPDQFGDQDCAMYRWDEWADGDCRWKKRFICQVIL